jgi:Flp pilus assembly pilin Flp
MREAVKTFLTSEDGGAVEWIITIIAGAIIAAVAYIKLKGAPGDIGGSIDAAGDAAKGVVDQIRPEGLN